MDTKLEPEPEPKQEPETTTEIPPAPAEAPAVDAPKGAGAAEPESMNQTIASIEDAIESMGKPSNEELGVNQDMRARLAAQAKLANDNREKQRVSGGVTGLVYSDESEDDEPKENGSRSSGVPSTKANELQPPLSLPATPNGQSNPSMWNVDDVVKWARSKGFDDAICGKFRGMSLV